MRSTLTEHRENRRPKCRSADVRQPVERIGGAVDYQPLRQFVDDAVNCDCPDDADIVPPPQRAKAANAKANKDRQAEKGPEVVELVRVSARLPTATWDVGDVGSHAHNNPIRDGRRENQQCARFPTDGHALSAGWGWESI